MEKKYQLIYADPPIDKLREYIEIGYCWLCGKGDWRRLAKHMNRHGLIADDIREMAILRKGIPVCIKEESELMSERTLSLLKEGKRKIPDWRLRKFGKVEYSQAGLIGMRKNAKHMQLAITEEVRRKSIEASVAVTRKPHPCPVCGQMIPHSKPICCSPECRKKRRDIGLQIGRTLYTDNPEHRLRMTGILNRVRGKSLPHKCLVCGNLIPKSRPRKYCSPECASNPLNLPIEDIKLSYLNGISSVKLSQVYNCCDHTIRRQLRKSDVSIWQ